MDKPEYLYHGSSKLFDIIKPFQAYDWANEQGNQKAVFATAIEKIAYAFALGTIPDETGNCGRIINPKYSKEFKMIFHRGHPNFGGKGYVYKMSSEGFVHAGREQWVNPLPVVPVEIKEIEVDDYLHLFRYATEEEREDIEKDITDALRDKLE
ncbi:MAG TPA: hypothetical protein DEG71_10720 [Clostridiales bacterium]|nr:hypothetical protein [Clostridiales bacterium]